jgi:hypothetical protein
MRPLRLSERARFRHIPMVDRRRARIIPVPWLPAGTAAMTLGRWILLRRGAFEKGLLAHELVHVMQWRELGVARFLFAYLRAYFRGRLRGLSHWHAYREIPLEIEARELSGF